MINNPKFASSLKKHQNTFHTIVPFNAGKDKLLQMNFTATNTALNNEELEDANKFAAYIEQKIKTAGALYGIGGYAEYRSIYNRSDVFNLPGAEPQRHCI